MTRNRPSRIAATDPTDPADRFMDGIRATIAEFERALRRERLLQAVRAKGRRLPTSYATGRGRIRRPLDAYSVIVARNHHAPYISPKRWERMRAWRRRNRRSSN